MIFLWVLTNAEKPVTSNHIIYIDLHSLINIAPSNFHKYSVKMQTALPMPSSKVRLKPFMHKSSNQVLFAEAGKEFVEFFFNVLRLTVGTLTTLLKPNVMFGHLGNIHDSIINLRPSFGLRMSSELIH